MSGYLIAAVAWTESPSGGESASGLGTRCGLHSVVVKVDQDSMHDKSNDKPEHSFQNSLRSRCHRLSLHTDNFKNVVRGAGSECKFVVFITTFTGGSGNFTEPTSRRNVGAKAVACELCKRVRKFRGV